MNIRTMQFASERKVHAHFVGSKLDSSVPDNPLRKDSSVLIFNMQVPIDVTFEATFRVSLSVHIAIIFILGSNTILLNTIERGSVSLLNCSLKIFKDDDCNVPHKRHQVQKSLYIDNLLS